MICLFFALFPGHNGASMNELAENLRMLCSYRPSISQVSRDLGLNRSQLNRYLAGTSAPRLPLLRRICDYFGVEPHEIMLPGPEFNEIIKHKGLNTDDISRDLRYHFDQIMTLNDPRFTQLSGTFFEYYYSMSQRGKILRSLVTFAPKNGHMFYRRLERMGDNQKPCSRHYRYQGIALMTGERVFMNDYEYSAGIEITQTVLYPDYSMRWTRLHGVKVGVSANHEHVPCCVRVYLERTPARASLISNLRACGLFAPDHPCIPPHILQMIDNRPSGPHAFDAFTSDQTYR
jgi:transcriptional regulator with XRE-family HTH domain